MLTKDQLKSLFFNNAEAIDLISVICEITGIWDDLIDKDREQPDENINKAFWLAMVVLPNNPFYRNNYSVLQPLLANGIIQWNLANKLEKSGKREREVAFSLRYAIVDFFVMVLYLLGGYGHVIKNGDQVRMAFQTDSFDNYFNELEVKYGKLESI